MLAQKPLASFCVKSYNQKKYLIEALKGAFDQTYRPLEIVISDDGSTDGSWEYIQQAVEKFRKTHTDVSVIINRNSPNLGNLGNWQKCCELAHGELLVKADGDDISLPERTAKVMAFWVGGGKRAKIVSCSGMKIDLSGRSVGSVQGSEKVGAFCAYTKDLWAMFPKGVTYGRAVDDLVYLKRALMIGQRVGHLEENLVLYRVGSGVSSVLWSVRTPYTKVVSMAILALREVFLDAVYLKNAGENIDRSFFSGVTNSLREYYDMRLLESGKTIGVRYAAFKRVQKSTPCCWYTPLYFHRLCFLLPRRIGDFLLYSYAVLNHVRKIVLNWR